MTIDQKVKDLIHETIRLAKQNKEYLKEYMSGVYNFTNRMYEAYTKEKVKECVAFHILTGSTYGEKCDCDKCDIGEKILNYSERIYCSIITKYQNDQNK